MTASPMFTTVGQPIPRVEGPEKVSGSAQYSADILPPGTLWAKNVRSPVPHARIVSINPTRARAVPGVRAVLTGRDLPAQRVGRPLQDLPLLCVDRVRFIGDKVAVVAAEDADAAEEAALLVDVEYEELPAVFDPLAALEPGAPVIHPDARSYVGFPKDVPADAPNACAYQVWDRGDVTQAFAGADLIVEHTFRTQLSHQGYLEPAACVVMLAGDRIEVWSSQKVPYSVRTDLADAVGRPESDIVVHAIKVGADFGSKGGPGFSVPAYYLAQATGRPVKFVNSSHEDLIAASLRHPSVVTIRSGVKRDGTIVAREGKVIFNTGAYGAFKPAPNGMLGGAGRVASCYTIPNLHVEAYCVYTNQVPCGYMRAPGSPQVLFAVEAHTDLIARELGMDPVELRERNLPAQTSSGDEDSGRHVLRAAANALWNEATGERHEANEPRGERREARGAGELVDHSSLTPQGSRLRSLTPQVSRLRGRGIGMANRGTGTGEGSSDITVNPDGTVTVVTAMPDNGQGGLTVVAQVAAESMGVPIERIRLIQSSTDALPIDVGSGASRMTNVAGHAVITASDQLKEQLAPLAAQALGTDQVEWASPMDGTAPEGGWRSPDGKYISLSELAAEMIRPGDPAAHAQVTITTPRDPDSGYCVQGAEVEVDPETGRVELRRMVTAQDTGTIINAIGHQSQIEGGLIQGVGYALMEELVTEEGRITNGHLSDYKMPTIEDLPELTTINFGGSGPGPFGAKAIGEIPIIPTAGAIANAVADAIGAPIFELPITPERVLAALDRRQS